MLNHEPNVANAEPPAGAGRPALKEFYLGRARARAALGRLAGGIADGQEAVAHSRAPPMAGHARLMMRRP
jgi:hypothetical protein